MTRRCIAEPCVAYLIPPESTGACPAERSIENLFDHASASPPMAWLICMIPMSRHGRSHPRSAWPMIGASLFLFRGVAWTLGVDRPRTPVRGVPADLPCPQGTLRRGQDQGTRTSGQRRNPLRLCRPRHPCLYRCPRTGVDPCKGCPPPAWPGTYRHLDGRCLSRWILPRPPRSSGSVRRPVWYPPLGAAAPGSSSTASSTGWIANWCHCKSAGLPLR